MLDAEAAYAEAARRGYSGRRLVFVGELLGTGVATMLASRREAGVLDLPDLSAVSVAAARYPLFPVGRRRAIPAVRTSPSAWCISLS